MTPAAAATAFSEDICTRAPVIPVLVVHDPAHAQPLARALVAGGLPVLEVTLRTPAAIEVIAEMSQVEGGIVGAGTVLTPTHAADATTAGAKFAVSPGATDLLVDSCEAVELPLLPGTSTATEAMRLLERGYSVQKFFPAEAAGGSKFLKSLASPLPQIRFCPTGGVSLANASDYLSLPNVLCVGGSWVAPRQLIEAGDWDSITTLARTAAKLG